MRAAAASQADPVPPLRVLEAKIPAPVVTLAVALVMRWQFLQAAPQVQAGSPRAVATVVVALGSAAIAAAAFFAFWRAGTTINPMRPERASVLVTGGVYRFTRNPMYLSLLLLLVAYAIELAAPLALLGPLVFAAYITRYQVLPEERVLERKFGADWVRYRSAVRRWL